MEIIVYIYDGMTMLDAIGPYEVLRNMAGANVKFVAHRKVEIRADSNAVHLNPKYGIQEVESADILIVPGSTVGFVKEMKNKELLKWLRKIDQTTQWTTSVCSGSAILAAAGLLKGLKATSHWKVMPMLKDFGVIPVSERVVEQEKYLTAAGVSAGIDMGLYLADRIAGEKECKAIQLAIEYDPKPIYNSGNIEKADPDVIKLAEKRLMEAARKELSLIDMLKNAKTLYKLK